MVRSPCFDKNGRKKGAWSPEEDEQLRAYVQRFGHWNWRELPKFAGRKPFFSRKIFLGNQTSKFSCIDLILVVGFFRSVEMWEELQTEMVELPPTQC